MIKKLVLTLGLLGSLATVSAAQAGEFCPGAQGLIISAGVYGPRISLVDYGYGRHHHHHQYRRHCWQKCWWSFGRRHCRTVCERRW